MTKLTESQIEDLRCQHDLGDVAARFGAVLRKSGGKLVGSCPMCGGSRKAKRFEVKQDQWVCAVCHEGGDVISLVRKVRGVGFLEAVDWLGGPRVLTPAEDERLQRERAARDAKQAKEQEEYRERERKVAFGIWQNAVSLVSHDLARAGRDYMAARNLLWPDDLPLRYAPELPYFHGHEIDKRGHKVPRVLYRGPAIVSPIIRPDHHFGAVHMTFIDPARPGKKIELFDPEDGELLPAKKSRGSTSGGRIELVRPAGPAVRLFFGEGIETVMSIYTAFWHLNRLREGDAFWTSVDLGNLGGKAVCSVDHPTLKQENNRPRRVPGPEPDMSAPAVPVPDSVVELITLGDGDSEPFLTHMAHERARRRYERPGRITRSPFAPDGFDFSDVLQGKALETVA